MMRQVHPIPLLALLSFVALLAGGCSSQDDTDPTTPAPASRVDGTLTDLPPGHDPSEITVFAGGDSTQVSTSGDFSSLVADADIQFIVAVDQGGNAVAMNMYRPDGSSDIVLDASNTARALVMMHPLFASSSAATLAEIEGVLAGMPAFDDFVAILRDAIAGGYHLGDEDPVVIAALAEVYTELAAHVWTQYESRVDKDSILGPASGLEIVDLTGPDTSGELTYRVVNRKKRWIGVYSRTIAGDEVGSPQDVELLPSPNISILDFLLHGMGSLSTDTELQTVNVMGLDGLYVDCYGLGMGELSSDEWQLAVEPFMCSFVFDGLFPLLEALVGGSVELRGRPRDNPFIGMVSSMIAHCGTMFLEEIYVAIRTFDAPALISGVIGCLLETIIDQPRHFADLVIRQVAHSMGEEAAAQISRRLIGSIAAPLRMISMAVDIANGLWTLGSILTSDSATHLMIETAAQGPQAFTLNGRVVDGSSGLPLAEVTVAMEDDQHLPIDLTATASDGTYTLATDAGSLTLRYSRPGYRGVERQLTLYDGDPSTYEVPVVELARASEATGGVAGRVVNAVNGNGVGSVLVRILNNHDAASEDIVDEVATNEAGDYRFDDLPAGNYTVTVAAHGYVSGFLFITVIADQELDAPDLQISPVGSGEFRFVLTWGATPSDLDSHMMVPSSGGNVAYEVRWNQRGSMTGWPFSALDRDDVDSYGPETITIAEPQPGTYSYAVYQWSSSPSIIGSGARVTLYSDDAVVREWTVPSTGSGRWWYVCDLIPQSMAVQTVNAVVPTAPAGMIPSKDMGQKP